MREFIETVFLMTASCFCVVSSVYLYCELKEKFKVSLSIKRYLRAMSSHYYSIHADSLVARIKRRSEILPDESKQKVKGWIDEAFKSSDVRESVEKLQGLNRWVTRKLSVEVDV